MILDYIDPTKMSSSKPYNSVRNNCMQVVYNFDSMYHYGKVVMERIEWISWTYFNLAIGFQNCENSLVRIFCCIISICGFTFMFYMFLGQKYLISYNKIGTFSFQTNQNPRYDYFEWKDEIVREGYYKEKTQLLRQELDKKKEYSEVTRLGNSYKFSSKRWQTNTKYLNIR